MEKKINAPIKTNRFLETNAYSVAIFEVENNSNIDTKLYLPVFDFREEVNENLSVVTLAS